MKGERLLKEIRIENVRSLKDTGWVPLAPVTLLIGQNSSGKSTFLRTFPLLKQSLRTRTQGPLLWVGGPDDYVDFGSFAETLSKDDEAETLTKADDATQARKASKPAIRLSFRFENGPVLIKSHPHPKIEYSVSINSSALKGDYVSRLRVTINHTNFAFNFTAKDVKVNGHALADNPLFAGKDKSFNWKKLEGRSMFGFSLPSIDGLRNTVSDLVVDKWQSTFDFSNSAFAELYNALSNFLMEDEPQDVRQSRRNSIIKSVWPYLGEGLCAGLSMEDACKTFIEDIKFNDIAPIVLKTFAKTPEERERNSLIFQLIYFYRLFDEIEEHLKAYYESSHYIAPVRATAERYYRMRNVSIQEVDYQGKNAALFLKGLSAKRAKEFQEWTRERFGFSLNAGRVMGGHTSLTVSVGQRTVNLSDTGFGYSQLLPIILQLWDIASTSPGDEEETPAPLVLAVEQPELHLHPQLQGKLVRALIAAIDLAKEHGNTLQLLLETHSETIVNCFGAAVADKTLTPDDVSVVLFDKTMENPFTEVHPVRFDEDGYLENWPIGFFTTEEEV